MKLDVTSDIEAACRLMASYYYGERGSFAYAAFDYINATFFDGALPFPLIQWAITPHGGCLGQTSPRPGAPPIITLHPSLLGGTETDSPWGIPAQHLGYCRAYDTILHECIHVKVSYLLGGATGPTSHNNRQWVSEVNRLAPLLGLVNINAAQSTTRRVPVDGETTKTGKAKTKVVRGTWGNVPFSAVATFPYGVRASMNDYSFYTANVLPFAHDV